MSLADRFLYTCIPGKRISKAGGGGQGQLKQHHHGLACATMSHKTVSGGRDKNPKLKIRVLLN